MTPRVAAREWEPYSRSVRNNWRRRSAQLPSCCCRAHGRQDTILVSPPAESTGGRARRAPPHLSFGEYPVVPGKAESHYRAPFRSVLKSLPPSPPTPLILSPHT